MDPVASFPHLSAAEFQTACNTLANTFNSLQYTSQKGKWLNVDFQTDFERPQTEWELVTPQNTSPEDVAARARWETDPNRPWNQKILQITQELPERRKVKGTQGRQHDEFEVEEDDDEEALVRSLTPTQTPTSQIKYEILLSPTYRVPVLYFYVADIRSLAFPPKMDTLQSQIIAPEYIDQTKDVGVLGGITITDHPVQDRPVFFIHPCRTAEVVEASVGGSEVTPFEYLLMWIGAMGKTVGLDVPMELVLQGRETRVQFQED